MLSLYNQEEGNDVRRCTECSNQCNEATKKQQVKRVIGNGLTLPPVTAEKLDQICETMVFKALDIGQLSVAMTD